MGEWVEFGDFLVVYIVYCEYVVGVVVCDWLWYLDGFEFCEI